jgi:hypothetical protein
MTNHPLDEPTIQIVGFIKFSVIWLSNILTLRHQRYLMSFKIIVVGIIFVLTPISPALAYLDTGTISMVFQAVISALAVSIVFLRHYIQKIIKVIFGKKTNNTTNKE